MKIMKRMQAKMVESKNKMELMDTTLQTLIKDTLGKMVNAPIMKGRQMMARRKKRKGKRMLVTESMTKSHRTITRRILNV